MPLSNEISMEKTKETLIEAVKLAKKIQPELNYNNPSKDALSFTRKIIILYNTQPNLSSFYSVYSTECIFAAKYFGLEQSYAALLMIKVFDVIAKSGKEKGVSSQVQDEVTEREKGIFFCCLWPSLSVITKDCKFFRFNSQLRLLPALNLHNDFKIISTMIRDTAKIFFFIFKFIPVGRLNNCVVVKLFLKRNEHLLASASILVLLSVT